MGDTYIAAWGGRRSDGKRRHALTLWRGIAALNWRERIVAKSVRLPHLRTIGARNIVVELLLLLLLLALLLLLMGRVGRLVPRGLKGLAMILPAATAAPPGRARAHPVVVGRVAIPEWDQRLLRRAIISRRDVAGAALHLHLAHLVVLARARRTPRRLDGDNDGVVPRGRRRLHDQLRRALDHLRSRTLGSCDVVGAARPRRRVLRVACNDLDRTHARLLGHLQRLKWVVALAWRLLRPLRLMLRGNLLALLVLLLGPLLLWARRAGPPRQTPHGVELFQSSNFQARRQRQIFNLRNQPSFPRWIAARRQKAGRT